jgi:DNA (cytosine-5)-methyltransferase 1
MENVAQIKQPLNNYFHLIKEFHPQCVILHAEDFGVPQVRKRCFTGDFTIPLPTTYKAPIPMGSVLTQEYLDSVVVSNNIYKSDDPNHYLREGGPFLKKHPPLDINKPARIISDGTLRQLTPRECAQLQTFPQDFDFMGTTSDQYLQIGNAVPPSLAYRIALAQLGRFH